jgi:hypothetical protein
VSSLPDDRDRPKTLSQPPANPEFKVETLAPLPKKPTLMDLLVGRLNTPRHGMQFAVTPHVAQSAAQALKAGLDEETVLACLLHDIGMGVARPDHGWWGAQLIEPYVPERVTWAVRFHQALRFYPDASVGYEYPAFYQSLFGPDYKPPEYIEAAYRYARNHQWYMSARHVTMYDDYSFDQDLPLNLDPFVDIIGRHFRQPVEGLGNDTSPSAHMWRTIIDPSKPL